MDGKLLVMSFTPKLSTARQSGNRGGTQMHNADTAYRDAQGRSGRPQVDDPEEGQAGQGEAGLFRLMA